MKKNQNGVTLIALAVTIIVMLILAGATMSTLNGENGLLTQSRKAAAANTEASVKEKMNTAFTSVSMEVQMESASNPAYDAEANILHYVQTVKNQLGEKFVSANTTNKETTPKTIANNLGSTKGKYQVYAIGKIIYIDYADATFNQELTVTDIPTRRNEYPMLRAQIAFDINTLTYTEPTTHAL